MMRRGARAWAFVGVIGLFAMGRATAQPAPYTVNGDPRIAIFDANMNGIIGDVGDCIMTADGSGSTFVISATQQLTGGAVPLQICQPCIGNSGVYTGTGFVSSNFAEAQITDTCVPNLGTPHVTADFSSSSSSPSPSPVTTGRAAGAFSPIDLEAARLFNGSFPFDDLGSGFLCNAGGAPAVQVTDRRGVSLLINIGQGSDGNDTFTCVPILMPRADNSQKVVINSCTPSNGGVSFLSMGGQGVAEIDLNGLPNCSRASAPTASQTGLIVLALALLGTGTWAMSRRRGFVDALPPV